MPFFSIKTQKKLQFFEKTLKKVLRLEGCAERSTTGIVSGPISIYINDIPEVVKNITKLIADNTNLHFNHRNTEQLSSEWFSMKTNVTQNLNIVSS